MAKILISYRRDDSGYQAGGIRDKLAAHFGNENVFMDVDSIPFGHDFRVYLDRSVGACDYLIAVIGRTWLTVCDEHGRRRLDNPADFVRLEVEAALRRGIPVIPVLIENVPPPAAGQLPESLAELAYRNAVEVRRPPDFNQDVEKLIRNLDAQDRERLRQTELKQAEEEQQRRAAEAIELDRQREMERQRREADAAERLRRQDQSTREAELQKQPVPEKIEKTATPVGDADRGATEPVIANEPPRRSAQDDAGRGKSSWRLVAETLAPDGSERATATRPPQSTTGLNIPSIALIACGLLAVGLSIAGIFHPTEFLWDLFSVKYPNSLERAPIFQLFFMHFLPSVLFYGFLAYSAFRMRSPHHRATAFAGGIMAVLPVSLFFVLTCPFGIWVLKQLMVPESQRAIESSTVRPTERQLDASSRALAIGGLAATVLSLFAVYFCLAVRIGVKQYGSDYFDPALCYLWLNALYYGFVAFAGDRMRSRRSYGIAIAGARMAMLPVSPLFFVTCPLGIWAIRQFKRRDVMLTFASSDIRSVEYRLDGPSRGLIVAGLVSAAIASVFAILSVGYLIAVENSSDPSYGSGYSTSHGGDFALAAILALDVLYYGIVTFAGIRMQSLRGYRIALAGSILAILPVSPFFVLTIYFGFSALRRLRRPETKKAFQS